MAAGKQLVVFVHGWSVSNLDTYGGLPARLAAQAKTAGLDITVEEIFLGKYVSFRDEVRVPDIAYAFQQAFERDLAKLVERHGRFAAITHSTGGPVMRDWADRYHGAKGATCPMSHLVMLAPANFGSALAHLGKSRLSRVKTWFQGVEPGTGVLDWLELGSRDGLALNTRWIRGEATPQGPDGVFQFVITGQTIDRKLYDNLNTYTGELGSDGVVRVPAANLNATYVCLQQVEPLPGASPKARLALKLAEAPRHAPRTAFLIVPGKSHSGSERGIMRSVKADPDARGADKDRATLDAILACFKVRGANDYTVVCDDFDAKSAATQQAERIEYEDRLLLDRHFIHDRRSMLVFRIRDTSGAAISDFDLLFTAGAKSSPNELPEGFATDRQRNQHDPGTLTYFFDYDLMNGAEAVVYKGEQLRAERAGAESFGLRVDPRPTEGLVHYLPAEIAASAEALHDLLRPNETTIIDIVLQRNIREGVFRLVPGVDASGRFDTDKPGEIV
jgi:hypothetical protein